MPVCEFGNLGRYTNRFAEVCFALQHERCATAVVPMLVERPSVNLALRRRGDLLSKITILSNYAFKAAAVIAKCRTSAMGTHTKVKCECGRMLDANSCRARFCPLCSVSRANEWLTKWRLRLLPVPHFHLVFTIPHQLNFFWRRYPVQMGDIFFAAVSQTLATLLADPQWLGARAGILAMLQTWDNELKLHPHLHLLITAGGADKFGNWIGMKRGPEFFIPHLVIARMFRKNFMKLMRQAEYSGAIKAPAGWSFSRRMKFMTEVGAKAFVVQIFGPYAHGVGVLKYFAGHVRGGPIANSRIMSVTNTHVTFRMKPRPNLAELANTLEIGMFLERFLTHIPPPGLHIVRASGLYSPSSKLKVEGLPERTESADAIPAEEHARCPRCKLPLLTQHRAPSHRPSHSPSIRIPTPARASPMAEVV